MALGFNLWYDRCLLHSNLLGFTDSSFVFLIQIRFIISIRDLGHWNLPNSSLQLVQTLHCNWWLSCNLIIGCSSPIWNISLCIEHHNLPESCINNLCKIRAYKKSLGCQPSRLIADCSEVEWEEYKAEIISNLSLSALNNLNIKMILSSHLFSSF